MLIAMHKIMLIVAQVRRVALVVAPLAAIAAMRTGATNVCAATAHRGYWDSQGTLRVLAGYSQGVMRVLIGYSQGVMRVLIGYSQGVMRVLTRHSQASYSR